MLPFRAVARLMLRMFERVEVGRFFSKFFVKSSRPIDSVRRYQSQINTRSSLKFYPWLMFRAIKLER